MTRLLAHLRGQAVAYLALFVALGGTSYAALSLPANSVGTRQIRNGAVTTKKIANGSISAIKLDSRSLGGAVTHWAHVSQTGQILSGSRGARATASGAQYTVTWGSNFSSRCAALVTPAAVPGIAPIADSTGVGINQPAGGKGKTVVYVWTYNNGTAIQAPFYVAIVC